MRLPQLQDTHVFSRRTLYHSPTHFLHTALSSWFRISTTSSLIFLRLVRNLFWKTNAHENGPRLDRKPMTDWLTACSSVAFNSRLARSCTYECIDLSWKCNECRLCSNSVSKTWNRYDQKYELLWALGSGRRRWIHKGTSIFLQARIFPVRPKGSPKVLRPILVSIPSFWCCSHLLFWFLATSEKHWPGTIFPQKVISEKLVEY